MYNLGIILKNQISGFQFNLCSEIPQFFFKKSIKKAFHFWMQKLNNFNTLTKCTLHKFSELHIGYAHVLDI